MDLVTQPKKSRRRIGRLRKRKNLIDAIKEQVRDYNIIGVGNFKANTMYRVCWMVNGKEVSNNIVLIPADECTNITPTEWFHTLVKTILFGYDITHADLIVSEVKDDISSSQNV